jgi:hypothetical protein
MPGRSARCREPLNPTMKRKKAKPGKQPPTPKQRKFATMRICSNVTGIAYEDLRRAKSAGCPAFKINNNVFEDELMEWLRANAGAPGATVGPGAGNGSGGGKVFKNQVVNVVDSNTELGAGNTLSRLESYELALNRRLIESLADPDATDEQRLRNESAWLKSAKELRAYEKETDESKRGTSAAITQAQAVEQARALVAWLRVGISNAIHNACPLLTDLPKPCSPRDVAAIVDPRIREAISDAISYGHRLGKMSSWLAEACILEIKATEPEPVKKTKGKK